MTREPENFSIAWSGDLPLTLFSGIGRVFWIPLGETAQVVVITDNRVRGWE